MFFILSKVLGLIFEPLNVLVLLALAGLLLALTRFRRLGLGMATTAFVLFLIAGYSPLANLLLRPLEDRFPSPATDMPAPAGIVVLGGAMDEDISLARGQPALTDAAERLTTGVALARRYPNAKLVFTGGSSHLNQHDADEARGVRDLWTSLGVPATQMMFEDKSRNTFENATMTRDLVQPKPGEIWLLVTSASHMPRSVGIFRNVGWAIVPYPVDYRTFGDARDNRPSAGAILNLAKLELALHEWVGLIAYRLTGKTDALFPGP